MRRSTLAIALYVALVFLSGVLVGGFGYYLYLAKGVSAKSGDYRRRYIEEMKSRLNLKPEQLSQLNSILDETRRGFEAIRERSRPEMRELQERQRDKVRAMLDDAQRTEYKKMLLEREKAEKSHGGNR